MKVKYAPLTAALLLAVSVCKGSNESGDKDDIMDNGVLVLTNQTLPFAIKVIPQLVVLFYAPWCGPSRHFLPDYTAIASTLIAEKSPIRLAKIDIDAYPSEVAKYGIQGYPSVRLFLNGRKGIGGHRGYEYESTLSWIRTKTGQIAVPLTSENQLEAFIASPKYPDVAVVGFFDNLESSAAVEYLAAVPRFDRHHFGIVTDTSVAEAGGISGEAVVMYKSFDEGRVELSENLVEDEITEFVKLNAVPLLIAYNESTSKLIFRSRFDLDGVNTAVVVFWSEDQGQEKYLEPLRPVAAHFRHQLLFITANADKKMKMTELLGVNTEELPTARIVRFERLTGDMIKFRPSEPLLIAKPEKLRQWIEDYQARKLEPFALGQPLPPDWDQRPVKVLVLSNFLQVTQDPRKHVLVHFTFPSFKKSTELAQHVEKLAEEFKEREDVIIAEVDALRNDLDSIDVFAEDIPTIRLYRKVEEKEQVEMEIKKEETVTFEKLKAFLDSELLNTNSKHERDSIEQQRSAPVNVQSGKDKAKDEL